MSGTDYTLTPNLALKKPVTNADVDLWGTHWNENADIIDNLMSQAGADDRYVNVSGDAMTGGLAFTGGYGSGNTDYSKGISLYNNQYGFSVTNNSRLNVGSWGSIGFNIYGGDQLVIGPGYINSNAPINLPGDPTSAYQAATKQYVDAHVPAGGPFLPLSGGTMLGAMTLAGNATQPLQPVTLQQMQAALPGSPGPWLPLTGGTLSGPGNLNVAGVTWHGPGTPPATATAGSVFAGGFTASSYGANLYWDGAASRWRYSIASPAGLVSFGGSGAGGGITFNGVANGSAGALATLGPAMSYTSTGALGVGGVTVPADAAIGTIFAGLGAALQSDPFGSTHTSAWLTSNAYSDGGAWKMRAAGQAGAFFVGANAFAWQTGQSGAAAGDTISWTQRALMQSSTLNMYGTASDWPGLSIYAQTGTGAQLLGYRGNVLRWNIQLGDGIANSGSNAGSNFSVSRYDDSGTYIDTPLQIPRSTGMVIAGVGAQAGVTGAGFVNIVPTGNTTNAGLIQFYNSAGTRKGYMGYSDANNVYISCDGLNLYVTAGVTTFTGAISVTTNCNANYFMSATGAFYVANNTSYYLARNGSNGTWQFVENAVETFSITSAGNVHAAGQIVAATGIYARNGSSGLFPGGNGVALQYNPSWYVDWNSSSGTWSYMNGSYGPEWIIRADQWCYNALNVVGGVGPYQNISDERAKADIVPAEYGLDTVLNINPIRFRRLGKMPDRIEVGFSAQQLRGVIPEAVMVAGIELPDGTGGMDDPEPSLSVGDTAIVAAMVNAIKTLNARIVALEARTIQ